MGRSHTPQTKEYTRVAIKAETVAHLKWLNEEYGHPSLEGTLEEVICITYAAYYRRHKIGLVIKTPKRKSRNKDEPLVIVYIPTASIAHLKWLDENYIHAESLDDALDLAIEIAAFIWRNIKNGTLQVVYK